MFCSQFDTNMAPIPLTLSPIPNPIFFTILRVVHIYTADQKLIEVGMKKGGYIRWNFMCA